MPFRIHKRLNVKEMNTIVNKQNDKHYNYNWVFRADNSRALYQSCSDRWGLAIRRRIKKFTTEKVNYFTIVLASSIVTLPEIWKAQLQLLAGFISSDVVGGRSPLKLRKNKQTWATVNYNNTIQTNALFRTSRNVVSLFAD